MDCDNDHSEDPADWIILEKLEEFFEEIDYAAAPSRNHMKEKDGKAARPKFHVYFPIEETAGQSIMRRLRGRFRKSFPSLMTMRWTRPGSFSDLIRMK